ncbi:putative FmdB family regulatory protein [Naumannella cuiyingiana]|uniref:Putative FmdB family regulatory protein n=1 Tax=Naumannella cuiyingiana TaxID=1347891 RepID=A0A7Z0ILJ5_9ACTN|nr:FmdB family zinc ribbon protein [Naumannella cuiyingiana]NYI71690.1 putative FmdB family regulatory protein [Naumannella cuiyingiana]
MPTYQYRCNQCGHDLEAVQKFTDPALTECPECGGPLRKVYNAVGVVFKGSGFYKTDSRSKSSNSSGGSSSGSSGGSGSSGSSGSSGGSDKSATSGSGEKKAGSATSTGS